MWRVIALLPIDEFIVEANRHGSKDVSRFTGDEGSEADMREFFDTLASGGWITVELYSPAKKPVARHDGCLNVLSAAADDKHPTTEELVGIALELMGRSHHFTTDTSIPKTIPE